MRLPRLVLAWAFDVLGVHRVELQTLASNSRAINCYLACGFRQEGVRREAELYPDGWKDFIMMGILRSEHAVQAGTPGRAASAHTPTRTADGFTDDHSWPDGQVRDQQENACLAAG